MTSENLRGCTSETIVATDLVLVSLCSKSSLQGHNNNKNKLKPCTDNLEQNYKIIITKKRLLQVLQVLFLIGSS